MSEKKKERIKREISVRRALIANFIDMLIIVVISVAVLLIGDIVMTVTLGMFVADLITMLLFLIIIVTIVYNTLLHSSRKKSTFGQRASKLIIANGEVKSEKR
ncbi:MAG TPA: RDD family protein [Clostridiaceae bacterium]|nr:RDD family protein [Clostridiaceae bacterium]